MMVALSSQTEINLPNVRGKQERNAPLAKLTWFRVGGTADVLFTPADEEDLAQFLSALDPEVPVMPIGVGSNMLIRDGGIRGVVIRLGKNFSNIQCDGVTLTAGAGTPDIAAASAARDHEIAGLEFLRGVPGTIGGAIRMNAGAYGTEVADVFESATAVDRSGQIHQLDAGFMNFAYRHSDLPADFIVTSATFKGQPGERAAIEQRMQEISDAREESQPLRTRTGGSTFKNPNGHKAWQLVDEAGCRGLKIGGAMVSEKHCNFLINDGSATAKDIEDLGEEVRRRVLDTSGVSLTWEIRIVGEVAS